MTIPSLTDEELRAHAKAANKSDGETQMTVDKGDIRSMVSEIQGARTARSPKAVAEYIYDWLEVRNGGEFSEMMCAQRVGDRRLAIVELEAIITHNGRPPHWGKT